MGASPWTNTIRLELNSSTCMDEHTSSCIAVYITIIDLIHSLCAEKFLKTSNVLFCYCRGRRPGRDCYVLIMHEPLRCITNTSTLGCSGHLRIRLPDIVLPPWPLNFIGLEPPLLGVLACTSAACCVYPTSLRSEERWMFSAASDCPICSL